MSYLLAIFYYLKQNLVLILLNFNDIDNSHMDFVMNKLVDVLLDRGQVGENSQASQHQVLK